MEVAVGVEEVLGDRAVGTGVGLADKVLQIGFKVRRLRVRFRVGGDFDGEVIAGLGADELDQLVGVAQLAAGVTHAGGQVAAQGDDALDAVGTVVVDQVAQVFARVADAGQVRCGRNLHLAVQLQHGAAGAFTGGAAGTVGDGKEFRACRSQGPGGGEQFFVAGFGLGREELEADGGVGRHYLSTLGRASASSLKLQAASNPRKPVPASGAGRALEACSLRLTAINSDSCRA